MIHFNVPPFVGTEFKYMQEAVNNHKICGDGPFTKKCNEWLQNKFSAKKVMLTTSGSSALDMAAMLCEIKPGDEVILPSFTFSSTANAFVLAGATLVFVDIRPDTMNIDEKKIEVAITDKTKVLILPFPNNPTGAIMNRTDLEAIAKVIEEKDLFVLSDEIYSELTYSGKHVSIAEISGMRDRTVLINGFSKAYAMTGWRLGYAAAPALILKQMLKIHQFAIMCAPTTSQYAAVDALRNGDEDIARMKKAYDERRKYLLKEFRALGMDCFEPYGAFYMFPCIKRFGMTSDEFANRLLQEEKLALVPGTAFGDCGEGYLRVSYAYSLEDLQKAIERIKRFVARLDGEKKC